MKTKEIGQWSVQKECSQTGDNTLQLNNKQIDVPANSTSNKLH